MRVNVHHYTKVPPRGQRPHRGANYSITAGKRSAPADRQRIYMWAPRGATTANKHRISPTPGRRHTSCLAGVRPLWGRSGEVSPFRGRASLTRGYRVVRPLWGRQPRGKRAHPTRTGSPPRRDAIHRVSHRPDGPAQGKNAEAGLRPERVRRDESRLYAAASHTAEDPPPPETTPRGRRPHRGRTFYNRG